MCKREVRLVRGNHSVRDKQSYNGDLKYCRKAQKQKLFGKPFEFYFIIGECRQDKKKQDKKQKQDKIQKPLLRS